MTLTAEQMSRIGALASSGADFDDFVTAAKLSGEDRDEAEEMWDEIGYTVQTMKPGQQLALPGEWS